MSSSSPFCNDTELLVGNLWFWTGETFKLIAAPSAALWNSLLIVVLWKSTALHINVHILLINISCCATLSSLILLAKSLFTLIAVIAGETCWIRVPYHSLCQFQTGIFFASQLPIFGSIVMLGFERLYAALKIDTYEIDSGSCLAKIFVTLMWLGAIAVSVVLVITVPDDVQLSYCNGLFMLHRNTIAVLAAVLPLFVFLVAVLYVSIWLSNRRQLKRYWINQARYSLAGRLQRQHSVAITEMMLPAVLLQAVCWTVVVCAVAAPRLRNFGEGPEEINNSLLIVAQYSVYLVVLIHMNLHPLMCLWFGKMFHGECRRLLPFTAGWWPTDIKRRSQSSFAAEPRKDTEQHFQLLDNQWKKAELKMLRESRKMSRKAAHHTSLKRRDKRRHSEGEALKQSTPVLHERFNKRHRSSVIVQSEPVSYAPVCADNESTHV